MKLLQVIILFLLTSTFLSAQEDISQSFEFDGETREYVVHLPPNFDESISLPVVLNFHGLGSNTTEQIFYSAFNQVADTANFIVVYPQGLVRNVSDSPSTHWNANFGTGVDDLGFVNLLIDYLYTDYNIDLSRVYSTGMSNGGYMSYHLACELSERIAAIASVTGAMNVAQENNCPIERPIPIMQIHGTNDDVVLYSGALPFQNSIPDIVDLWVNRNNCAIPGTEMEVTDSNMGDNTTASYIQYECEEDTEVIFYTIQDGGHTWPGAIPIPTLGNTNQDFNASQTIWAFFNRFSHPNPQDGTIISSNSNIFKNENLVKIAPNPFDENILVTIDLEKPTLLQIYDALGRLVMQLEKEDISISMNISTYPLPIGFYTLMVENEEGKIIKKMIKK